MWIAASFEIENFHLTDSHGEVVGVSRRRDVCCTCAQHRGKKVRHTSTGMKMRRENLCMQQKKRYHRNFHIKHRQNGRSSMEHECTKDVALLGSTKRFN